MGMFDTLKCEYPLPGNPPRVDDFQTKCLDCVLDRYTITVDGRLIHHQVKLEEVKEEDRQFYGDERWEKNKMLQLCGCLKAVPIGDVEVCHDGELIFYDYVDEKSFRYKAVFSQGKLQGIEMIC